MKKCPNESTSIAQYVSTHKQTRKMLTGLIKQFTLKFQHVFRIYSSRVWHCLECFDTHGSASERASGLEKIEWWGAEVLICLGQSANDLHIGPADATATPASLASLKSGMGYLSGAGLPRFS